MYKSPIEIVVAETTDSLAERAARNLDEQIYIAIQKCGVAVNKEELVRALNYDREQYQQGYEDGVRDIVDDMQEFARDVAIQFGYYCKHKGRLHISHGGLSTLEWAFNILDWEDPHPVPECECEIEGCHEHATCGTPTDDGYKFVCHKHYREIEGRT